MENYWLQKKYLSQLNLLRIKRLSPKRRWTFDSTVDGICMELTWFSIHSSYSWLESLGNYQLSNIWDHNQRPLSTIPRKNPGCSTIVLQDLYIAGHRETWSSLVMNSSGFAEAERLRCEKRFENKNSRGTPGKLSWEETNHGASKTLPRSIRAVFENWTGLPEMYGTVYEETEGPRWPNFWYSKACSFRTCS